LRLDLAHAGEAVGGGELGHDEAAAGLLVGGGASTSEASTPQVRFDSGCVRFGGELAGVLDEAAEDGVGDAGHGGEHGRGRDAHVADGEAGGDAGVLGHRVLGGRVPLLLLEGVALLQTVDLMLEVCPRCDGMGMRVVVRPSGERFAEECDCRQTRKLSYAFNKCKIPPKYEDATLESYDVRFAGADQSLQMAQVVAKRFADDYPAMMTPGRGLMFSGSSGLGEDASGGRHPEGPGAGEALRGAFLLLPAVAERHPKLLESADFFDRTADIGAGLSTPRCLVLDDLGSVKPTDWVWDMVSMVLNTRYNHKRMTIVTTNFENLPAGTGGAGMTLGDRIGDRMRSRLLEMCREVKMRGADYRETLGRNDAFSPNGSVAGRGF
jgi:DNA replication protein DnaC